MAHAGSITVAVRVRPPTEWEASRLPEPATFDHLLRGVGTLSSPRKVTQSTNVRNIVDVVDDRILTFDPPERDIAKAFSERGFMPPGSKRYKDRRFLFDRVFDGHARQTDVYESTTQTLLDGLLDGYNSTVFAYGATGCGKTFTISGSDGDPGIIYLAMADLFQRIEDKKDERVFEVAVTFLEIYNEEIRDLLVEPGTPAPRGGLAIREDNHVKVVNLTELRPANADEVKDIVILGNQRRTQSPTHANETSSRSHAVLQVHVTQCPRTANTTETRTMATLSIIDLAGSERASATKNMGERMIEGANINKSLLALGNCINALCDSGGTARHVPYRNSKLTRLLKFSLGGNCKTVMIVCVAPTSVHFEDTHNALIYAERATKIKTKVVTRNVLNVNRHVGQYVEAINRLNEEVAQLKAKLADRQAGVDESAKRKRAEMLNEINRVKSDIILKVNQNRVSVGEGARCKAILDVTEAKAEAIRKRANASTTSSVQGQDFSQLEAEKLLLSSLIAQQEAVLRPDSAISSRLQRSRNADSLFDATLKAVVERRAGGKLDEVAAQNIQLLVECAKAEMQQHRAEEMRKAYEEALEKQTPVLLNLYSLVARCTVMLRQSANALQAGPSAGCLDAGMLQSLASTVDGELVDMVGFGVPQVAESLSAIQSSVRRSMRISNAAVQPLPSALSKATRRPSNLNSSPKKAHRSPRKSRASLSKGRPPVKRESEKKTVRWKEDIQSVDTSMHKESLLNLEKPTFIGQAKPAPSVCSESDWEDEKTEDSMGMGLNHPPLRRVSASAKRSRNSRLDPAFLRTREPTLESLMESGDEDHSSPFTDRINQTLPQRVPSTSVPKKPYLTEQRVNPPVQRAARRISSIGPMRKSRNRRRSSILMDTRIASAPHYDENVRPNPTNDSKLMSMSMSTTRRQRSSITRPFRPLGTATSVGNTSVVVTDKGNNTSDASGEASFRGLKPTWR